MNDKMIRFLKSLHIENIEDFDMSFDMLGRNRFIPDRWDMYICKKTPWEYHLLQQFIDSLVHITYQYSLRFSYIKQIKVDDAVNLFSDWYRSIYRVPHKYEISIKEGKINFVYHSKDEVEKTSQILKDFKSFLDFICYDFELTSELIEIEEAPSISKREMNKITKTAKNEADESIEQDQKEEKIIVIEENSETPEIKEETPKQEEKFSNLKENEKAYLEDMENYEKLLL